MKTNKKKMNKKFSFHINALLHDKDDDDDEKKNQGN